MQTLSNFIDLFDVFTIKFEWQKDSGAYGEHFNELIKYLGLSDLKITLSEREDFSIEI